MSDEKNNGNENLTKLSVHKYLCYFLDVILYWRLPEKKKIPLYVGKILANRDNIPAQTLNTFRHESCANYI
jgi:hypothetical protein